MWKNNTLIGIDLTKNYFLGLKNIVWVRKVCAERNSIANFEFLERNIGLKHNFQVTFVWQPYVVVVRFQLFFVKTFSRAFYSQNRNFMFIAAKWKELSSKNSFLN